MRKPFLATIVVVALVTVFCIIIPIYNVEKCASDLESMRYWTKQVDSDWIELRKKRSAISKALGTGLAWAEKAEFDTHKLLMEVDIQLGIELYTDEIKDCKYCTQEQQEEARKMYLELTAAWFAMDRVRY